MYWTTLLFILIVMLKFNLLNSFFPDGVNGSSIILMDTMAVDMDSFVQDECAHQFGHISPIKRSLGDIEITTSGHFYACLPFMEQCRFMAMY